jgi:hypothetical protein
VRFELTRCCARHSSARVPAHAPQRTVVIVLPDLVWNCGLVVCKMASVHVVCAQNGCLDSFGMVFVSCQALVYILDIAWGIHTRLTNEKCPFDFEGSKLV